MRKIQITVAVEEQYELPIEATIEVPLEPVMDSRILLRVQAMINAARKSDPTMGIEFQPASSL